MKKYILNVNILKSDNNGKMKSEDFEFTFQESNLIEARNKAIVKAMELEDSFNNGNFEGLNFDTPLQAQLKEYKNFNAYSIELLFVPSEDWDYQIYGEQELTIEALEIEATHYAENSDVQFTEIEDLDGEFVEVLESNLEFFLN